MEHLALFSDQGSPYRGRYTDNLVIHSQFPFLSWEGDWYVKSTSPPHSVSKGPIFEAAFSKGKFNPLSQSLTQHTFILHNFLQRKEKHPKHLAPPTLQQLNFKGFGSFNISNSRISTSQTFWVTALRLDRSQVPKLFLTDIIPFHWKNSIPIQVPLPSSPVFKN